MDYNTFINTQFLPRAQGQLTALKNTLLSAGVAANRITGPTIPDTVDLRVVLVGRTNVKTITVYIELTDSSHLGGIQEGKAIITLFATDGTNEITHTYNAGNLLRYIDSVDIDALVAKLDDLEAACPALWVKIRTALGL